MVLTEREKKAYENCAREILREAGPVIFDFMPREAHNACRLERDKLGEKEFFEKYGDQPKK